MATRLVYNAKNLGNRHGRIKFGHVQDNNEIAAVQLLNGKDAGRHYMTMHQTGDRIVDKEVQLRMYVQDHLLLIVVKIL